MSVVAEPTPVLPPAVVLVADDDAAVRESTAALLRRAGYVCHAAASAAEVRAVLQQQEIDLVVADIVMPGNAELELTGELAERASTPPVVLMTGHPSLETAKKAVSAKVVGYLTKPVQFEELLAIVRRECGRQQARRFLRRRRQRLEVVLADLRQVELVASGPEAGGGEEALDAYLALLTEHMLSAICDLRLLAGLVAPRSPGDNGHEQPGEARSFVFLEALRHAITVLDRTKRSFKSRELAELRREFESLLGAPAPVPPAPLAAEPAQRR